MHFNPRALVSRCAKSAKLLVWMFALVILSGCASRHLPQDESLVLVRAIASEDINPDINQRPSPVEVHIYFLRNSALFLEQDYYSLIERPEQILRQDLVSSESMFISPGRTEHKMLKVDGEYEYIGLVVSFRDLDGSQWRALAVRPVPGIVSALWPERWRVGMPRRSLHLTVNEKEVRVSGP